MGCFRLSLLRLQGEAFFIITYFLALTLCPFRHRMVDYGDVFLHYGCISLNNRLVLELLIFWPLSSRPLFFSLFGNLHFYSSLQFMKDDVRYSLGAYIMIGLANYFNPIHFPVIASCMFMWLVLANEDWGEHSSQRICGILSFPIK